MRLTARLPGFLWPVFCALVACQPMSGASGPPLPPIPDSPRAVPGPVTENHYGTAVADPYRWLEHPGERRAGWVSGQAEAGRRWLDRLPRRDRVSDALEHFQSIAGMQLLEQYGEHVYFFHDPGGSNQSDLYRVRAESFHQWSCDPRARCDRLPADAEQVLAAAGWAGDRQLLSVAISPDGQRVAWREQFDGNGTHKWFWKAAGSSTAGVGESDARGAPTDLLWAHDSSGWYVIHSGDAGDRLEYLATEDGSAAGAVCPLESGTVIERMHRVEDRSGELLLRVASPGGQQRLLLCSVTGGSALRLDPGMLVDPRYLGSREGWHYFLHRRPDWRGEVIALTRSEEGGITKRSIVPPADRRLVDAVLTTAAQDPSLWLHYREGGRSVPAYHTGRPGREAINVTWRGMPGVMRIEDMVFTGGRGTAGRGAPYLIFSGPGTPPRVVRLREEGKRAETVWSAWPPAAMESFEVRRHDVDTGAGRPVPLYVAGSAAVLDSGRPAPLVLEAYGGFDEPVDLRFSPSRAAWMALGGVYAVAGVRGGGDRDQNWYLAGRGAGKLNSIRDLEAVMAWLMEQGITAPELLALRGYSQGATLASAVAARGRQPARALLASAGVMDMLRFPLHGAGQTWLAEYGDPRTSAGFDVLWRYSPYHRVLGMAGRDRHPLTLVMSRDDDPVVSPLHSYKYLAALRQAGVPAVLRLEQGATHAGTAPVDVLHQRHTDQWTLLLAVLRR